MEITSIRLPRWSTGNRRAAFTLAEMLVVAALFALCLVAVVAIERIARSAHTREAVQRDAYRAAMLGLEHIQSDLEGALVDPLPVDGLSLTYRLPRRQNGQPVFAPSGAAEYTDPCTVRLDGAGNLVRQASDGSVRVLAALGNQGQLSFAPVPDRQDLIRVTLLARHVEPGSPIKSSQYSLSLRAHLANQF